MKINLPSIAALLGAFVLGAICYQPAARALENLAVVSCTSTNACSGGTNHGAGAGVAGKSATGYGVTGSSTSADGIGGFSLSKTGLHDGVYGKSFSHGGGVRGESESPYGAGVVAYSGQGGDIFSGQSGSPEFGDFYVDANGNVHTSGLFYSNGGMCASGCMRPHPESYGTTSALPTIEDEGEARLQLGTAYVRIAPDFARAIDRGQSYLVFITPEGQTQGLYVTGRTPRGFYVRENGGRSNETFAYRIVARPAGMRPLRFPLSQPQTLAR